MAEGSNENTSSRQKSSEEEKNRPPAAPVQQGTAPATPPLSSQASPRPMVPPVRPVTVPQPSPANVQSPKPAGRRGFLKAVFAVGAVLSILPFVPWGTFLSYSVESGSAKRTLMQKVVVDELPKYGAAAGVQVNVKDLATFPPNNHWVFTYPTSGDVALDAQNPDTFVKYELIRLPEEMGGSNMQATDFVAFSKVCVHLWCSPNFNPEQTVNPKENGYDSSSATPPGTTHEQYECPCHGSIYRIPDGLAVAGPASLQPPPTNAIPMLTLQADSSGNLYAYYPNYDPVTKQPVGAIDADGELGYGRDFNSYQNFIKPKAQIPADLKDLTAVVG